MIEHRGRRSGSLYHTVVEVVGRNPDENEWIVTSGYGPHADWYRNLKADGLQAVWIGSTRHRASVRFLDNVEAGGVMKAYERARPKTAAILLREMNVSHDGSDEGRIDMMRKIPMVAFAIED